MDSKDKPLHQGTRSVLFSIWLHLFLFLLAVILLGGVPQVEASTCYISTPLSSLCTEGTDISDIEMESLSTAYISAQCTATCTMTVNTEEESGCLIETSVPDSGTEVGQAYTSFKINSGDQACSAIVNLHFGCTDGSSTSCKIPTVTKEPPKPDSSGNELNAGTNSDPVNTHNGELFFYEPYDLYLGGPMPLYFQRYYASHLRRSGIKGDLGNNWLHNFDHRLNWSGTLARYVSATGRVTRFDKSSGSWVQQNNLDTPYQVVIEPGANPQLYDPLTDRIYTFDFSTGGPINGKLIKVEDTRGNAHTLEYLGGGKTLYRITDGLGRKLVVDYDYTSTRIESVRDEARTYTVVYYYKDTNDSLNLTEFKDPRALSTSTYFYTYADTTGTPDHALMLTRKLYDGKIPYTQTYYGPENPHAGRVKTQTDAAGNTHTFVYDGQKTTITDPLGNTLVHTHTAAGQLAGNQREDGLSSALESDSTGRRSSVTDLMGDKTAYAYHAPSGKLASITHADGTVTSYSYTGRTLDSGIVLYDLTAITYPDGVTETFVRDAKGNLTARTDRGGHQWRYTYNNTGQVLTATNPEGGVTTHTYNADGTPASRTDPANNTTTYAYDVLGRFVTAINYPDGSTRSFAYNALNKLTQINDENGNSTSLTYYLNGYLRYVTDALSKKTTYTYDNNTRIATITDPLNKPTTFAYDELGRLKTLTDRSGNTTAFGYDARGRLTTTTDGGGKVWSNAYDAESIIASAQDPLSQAATFASDKMGRITRTTSPLGHATNLTYDAMGRVTGVRDPLGRITSRTYDARGLLTGITLPDGAASTYARNGLGLITAATDPNGKVWQRTYDNQGRLTTASDPLGRVTSYQYDNRNRLSRLDFPSGSLNLTYDGVGNITRRLYSDGTDLNFIYDAANRLTGAGGVALTYDANGRITGSNGPAITRDASGRIATITVATGKVITYTYDSRGLVATVTDWLGGTTAFTYDAAGRLTQMTRPNGITAAHTYNADGSLAGITEGSLSSIALTRDGNGQIKAATRTVPLEPAVTDSKETFSYDSASQVGTYTYDGMGRLTGDGGRTYTWDLASRLTGYTEGETSVAFTYDALGYRLSRTAGGATGSYVWNYALGLPSVSVMREGATDLRYYVHTPAGRLLYSIEAADGSRRYYHYDESGNTLFVTDGLGAVIGSYAYSPYGEILGSTGSLDNPFTWQGQFGVMQEGSHGLYYLRARYYDSVSGRFLSKDPVRAFNPRSINPYQYALENPLRFIDPLGKEDLSWMDMEERYLAKRTAYREMFENLGNLVTSLLWGNRALEAEQEREREDQKRMEEKQAKATQTNLAAFADLDAPVFIHTAEEWAAIDDQIARESRRESIDDWDWETLDQMAWKLANALSDTPEVQEPKASQEGYRNTPNKPTGQPSPGDGANDEDASPYGSLIFFMQIDFSSKTRD